MTRIEKIDFIREHLSEYRNTNILFGKPNHELDDIIKSIKDKKQDNSQPTYSQLKEENENLFLKLSETQRKYKRELDEKEIKIEILEEQIDNLIKQNEKLKRDVKRFYK